MKQMITMAALPTIIIALGIIAIIYVSRRLAWGFTLNTKILTFILGGIMLALFVGMVTIMKSNMIGVWGNVISNISNIGLGVLMILVCTTLAVDLVQLIFKFHPLKYGMAIVSITLLLSVYALWNAQYIRVYNQEIDIPNLVQPIRVAHVTDIHLGYFWGERAVERIVNIVQREEVDVVVITGDMFDGKARFDSEILEPFKRLTVPIYFVEGNHDGYSGKYEIKRMLEENGINVLNNRVVEFKDLQIIGLDYLLADEASVDTFHGSDGRTTIKEVLPTLGIDKSKASVLLHHNPIGVDYVADNGVNLYLAGHTHAGQLFPATLFAKAMFKYNKGLYRYNDKTQVYVSQGTGTFGPPMRLGTNSELTIIELK